MKKASKRLLLTLGSVLGLLVLALLIPILMKDFLVEILWYDSLGYLKYMWMKLGYRYVVLGAAILLFFVILFSNFWLASRTLGKASSEEEKGRLKGFRSWATRLSALFSLLLAIPLAMPLYDQWQRTLMMLVAPAAGEVDPVYNLDITFYLFTLPVLKLLHGRLLLVAAALVAALLVLYIAKIKAQHKEDKGFGAAARFHLSLSLVFLFLMLAAGLGIRILMLMYSTGSSDLFFGPGFTELVWVRSLIYVCLGLLSFSFVLLLVRINSGKGTAVLSFFMVLTTISYWISHWDGVPNAVDEYIVTPNRLNKQKEYIGNAIESTLAAYNLGEVERRVYGLLAEDETLTRGELQQGLDNIPLWDNELLHEVFQQLQSPNEYYVFSDVDVTRYSFEGGKHQAYLAAREMDSRGLQRKDWVNERLMFTHGYGAVAIPAAQKGEEPMDWYLRNMPLESEKGLRVADPSIYYGTGFSEWVVAPSGTAEFHYPGEPDVTNHYEGDGGIAVNSFWRKALLALYLKDKNFFWSKQVNRESRLHLRRSLNERLEHLAPFLHLDSDPYLVITQERLFWIQDAYTRSKWYPNAERYGNEGFNYIRNSVKIVMDAVDGDVTFYLSDPKDPIAQGINTLFPKLLKEMDEMPEELQSQLRYPRDIFSIQLEIFGDYHQDDPVTFFKGDDRMDVEQQVHQGTTINMHPYYLTLNLLDPDETEFVLLSPMLPVGRTNLRALLVVSCEPENYGQMVLYNFPRGNQVLGPPQINSLIDQNTDIARDLTLWNQQGSEVRRGKMIVLPMGRNILYIQPLYMRAAGDQGIPQLKRVIVSTEKIVVMDTSLERAMLRLEAMLSSAEAEDLDEPDVEAETLEEVVEGAGVILEASAEASAEVPVDEDNTDSAPAE